jgi:hypothetical protein
MDWIVGNGEDLPNELPSRLKLITSPLPSKFRLDVGSLDHGGGIDRDSLMDDIHASFSR